MIEKAPILFTPYLKSVIWGGDKICSYKGINQTGEKIGESWEISAVPGFESVVASGQYKDLKITDLIATFGTELLGNKVMERYGDKFPLLVKLIDAHDNLSVQVHPDDRLAKERHDSLGKTEMWYIIDAEEDARIFSGLKDSVTPDEYEKHIEDGTFENLLAVHDSHPGDVFFLPAGRVHAIGAGNLLSEIQESSDVTYRIYDYNRTDAQGNLRQLHTQLAKDAIDYNVYEDYKMPAPPMDIPDAEIIKCEHFNVHRVFLSGETRLSFDPGSFTIIMCVDGNVRLKYPKGTMTISLGMTVLCPAVLNELTVSGKATLLTSQA